ncbi:glycoside hydrolase family 3 C-terminal domain-containing protein [Steroidobacter sp. S1-65]|uniref:Glycoside hydrolase family 3 C-terminal domain-containing protein n=1 Tax=Steroidobacter gossypii TaxID=2805490 RepID=A0ABS1X0A3_9GAMM|nr:glycoside hydrolase family 3 C-terminal domain-containing protein [Steroidobacter gossypii]MBM0106633.1 glycoside hydrolase family 3 C-terminal domain-containing protein [Steroidobacter gossypii]
MTLRFISSCLLALCLATAASGAANADADDASLRVRAEQKAAALVGQLTLDEKVEQLLNTAPAIPRLGAPAYNWWTESLHGALGPVPTTNFPEPIGLAASFDEALLQEVAGAISVEVRALHALGRKTGRLGRIGTGLNTWSPNINIFRDPRWGRGQETYGEDPFLTARLGVAYVRGMQGPDPDRPDVIASPKHFAVHSGPESTRHHANVFVSPHDLEDTYLPAFRAAIVEGRAGSIMCAYNRVNGEPACVSNELLRARLRDAWKFNGYVVSDCDAVQDISEKHGFAPDAVTAVAAALKAGVDNECTNATLFDLDGLGNRYKQAYERGLISMRDIDQALIRLFSARYLNGDLPGLAGRPAINTPPAPVTTPERDALALKAAEKTLVLLKNDGVLPLKGSERIAVIGPHADATRVLRGNYSSALSSPPISLVDGLRRAMPRAVVTHVPWSPAITDGDPIPTSALRSPSGEPGLLAEYYDADERLPKRYATHAEYAERAGKVKFKSKPTVSRVEPGIAMRGNEHAQLSDYYRVVWTGFVVPPESGTYRIGLSGPNAELMLDGKLIAQHRHQPWGTRSEMSTLELQKGRRYPIRVTAEALLLAGIEVLWKRVSTQPEADLRAAAAQADVIVAAVGLNSNLEGEEMKVELEGFFGGDKTSIDLPADQRRLLEQAKATGKPLIVVLMNGSTLDVSWKQAHASGLIEAWYAGQAGGLAIGNVIAGKTNPAGRLPLTFYRSVEDLPPFEDYSMQGRTYRYFEGAPVYPFGFGLSYSSFEYGALSVQPIDGAAENGLRVTTTIRNTSSRVGEEVAQLYLDPPSFEGAPRLALRGFQRLQLRPGEQRSVTFELSRRDLSFVTRDGQRQIFSGEHTVSVGSGQPGTGVPVQSGVFTMTRVTPLAP